MTPHELRSRVVAETLTIYSLAFLVIGGSLASEGRGYDRELYEVVFSMVPRPAWSVLFFAAGAMLLAFGGAVWLRPEWRSTMVVAGLVVTVSIMTAWTWHLAVAWSRGLIGISAVIAWTLATVMVVGVARWSGRYC